MGGGGASFRVPITKALTVGAKGMYGTGLGRYGDSTLADLTTTSWGGFSPLHNASGLITVEANPTPRLLIWANYGGDYASRDDWGVAGATTSLGAPTADFCYTPTGATKPPASPPPRLQPLPPAANGAATGVHRAIPQWVMARGCFRTRAAPPPAIPATTVVLRLATRLAGPAARKRATCRRSRAATGMTFTRATGAVCVRASSTAMRCAKAGRAASGIGAKGIDNMFWTSFRYYLP